MKRKASSTPSRSQSQVFKKKTKKQKEMTLAKTLLSYKDVKSHYVTYPLTGVSTAGTLIYLTSLSTLVPGTGQVNNFIGSRIKPINLTIRVTAYVGDNYNTMRVGVFQQTGNSVGIVPSTFYTTVANPDTPVNSYPPLPFNTLSDRMLKLVINQDSSLQFFKLFIPGSKLLPITFNPGGTTISSGALCMVVLSDSLAPTHPSIQVYSHLKYTDQ